MAKHIDPLTEVATPVGLLTDASAKIEELIRERDEARRERDALREAAGLRVFTSTAKPTGAEVILILRDEFLQLVTAYNAVGLYKFAQDAQAVAIALNAFEDEHIVTSMQWPVVLGTNEENEPTFLDINDEHILAYDL